MSTHVLARPRSTRTREIIHMHNAWVLLLAAGSGAAAPGALALIKLDMPLQIGKLLVKLFKQIWKQNVLVFLPRLFHLFDKWYVIRLKLLLKYYNKITNNVKIVKISQLNFATPYSRWKMTNLSSNYKVEKQRILEQLRILNQIHELKLQTEFFVC